MTEKRSGSTRKRFGLFIVIVGPDGVGKTTLARELLFRYQGPTGYFHFRPPVRGPMRSMPPEWPKPPPSKGLKKGSIALGWLRLARNFVWFWVSYVVTVLPALRQGTLVVGDRWAYGYLAQPYALKYFGPNWLAALALGAMPQPDVVLNLTARPDLIHSRKQELTMEEIESELSTWAGLPARRMLTLDTSSPPDVVAAAAAERIGI